MADQEKAKGKGLLSASPKEIWISFRKRFLEQMPKKRYINLATVDARRINWFIAVPLILAIFGLSALFAKFLVLDRMDLVVQEQEALSTLQDSLAQRTEQLSGYDAMQELYAHYTFSGMTSEEVQRADRLETMQVLRRVVMSRTDLESWTLSGNTLTMTLHSGSLQEVNLLVQKLLAEHIVEYCNVSTAATESRSGERPRRRWTPP